MAINRVDPKTLGKYLIEKRLGVGNMGVVYKGYDPFVQRHVAVKLQGAAPNASEQEKQRYHTTFFNEAKAAGALLHPHIVSVFDAGLEGEDSYIVMEYVSGKNLLDTLYERGRLPVEQVIDIIFKCSKALEFAHRRGVIHRDVKPANVMMSKDGVLKIMDFGIASVMRPGEQTSTSVQGVAGTPSYMAPEQIMGKEAGPQNDIYALGTVMFQLLTGELPYQAPSLKELVRLVVKEPPPSLRARRPELPEDLDTIMERAMAKRPDERYRTASAFGDELKAVLPRLHNTECDIEYAERRAMLSKLEFFRDFTLAQIDEVMEAAVWEQFEGGQVVINQGDLDDSFFILITGTAEVMKDHLSIGWLYRGDCFGEMAFITRKARTASIMARSYLLAMKINADSMEETSEGCQMQYYKAFSRTLIKRQH